MILTAKCFMFIMCISKQHTKGKGVKTLKILISNTSDSPLYQQIKDQIKDAILTEELVEGDPLPSIRAVSYTHLHRPRERSFLPLPMS